PPSAYPFNWVDPLPWSRLSFDSAFTTASFIAVLMTDAILNLLSLERIYLVQKNYLSPLPNRLHYSRLCCCFRSGLQTTGDNGKFPELQHLLSRTGDDPRRAELSADGQRNSLHPGRKATRICEGNRRSAGQSSANHRAEVSVLHH